MVGATVYGHAHGEAYMLMTYRCEADSLASQFIGRPPKPSCGNTETVWNSRDGVTPFIIGCRYCDGEAKHVDWSSDVYAPDYQPAPGERIFVDLDPEEALRNRRDYVERWWDHPDVPMRDHDVLGPLGKDGAAARLAEADVQLFAGGTPDLIEVTEAVCDWLARGGGR